jgi:DNA-binding transcriptional regulator YbjK
VISQRAELIADTAIRLLAERGMRGLTHRAVDEAAALPPGSTSNYARTRAALLEVALARLTELETAQFAEIGAAGGAPGAESLAAESLGAESLADLMATVLHRQLTKGRTTTMARYELALEATRRPELRRVYDESGRRFRDMTIAVLDAAGSRDPVRHGLQLVAFGDGLLFDALAGAGATPSLTDLRAAFREILTGMLTATP